MTLVPRSRRRRPRRKHTRAAKAIRLAALVRALAAAARRRCAIWLALRGSPLGMALATGAVIVALARRRRRRRQLEADLGPPNESAPGHRVGPGTSAPGTQAELPAGPNEGAAGHEPASEGAEPLT